LVLAALVIPLIEEAFKTLGVWLLSGQNITPAEGFVANFLSLTCKASIEADYYAYSDQDDVWESDKLERAVRWLQTVPENIPALYCSRTRLVDAENNEIGLSPLFSKPPSFANALICKTSVVEIPVVLQQCGPVALPARSR